GWNMRVDLKMSADVVEVGRKHFRHYQVAKVVQQAGQVGHAKARPVFASNTGDQALDHGSRADSALPIVACLTRAHSRGIQGSAKGQAERQVEYHIETQYTNNGVVNGFDFAGSR